MATLIKIGIGVYQSVTAAIGGISLPDGAYVTDPVGGAYEVDPVGGAYTIDPGV